MLRTTVLSVGDIVIFARRLRAIPNGEGNRERIDLISALEGLKSAIAAAQAVIGVQLDDSIRAERRAQGRPEKSLSKGVPTQLALARRESPNRGGYLLKQARVLVEDMPNALERLWSGALNESRTSLIIKEIACLDSVDRRHVDQQLCGEPSALEGKGDGALGRRARELAADRDYVAVVERARKAPSRRCVTVRPIGDSMAHLIGLLPMRDAVAVRATLARDADAILAAGESSRRTRDQIMADLFVERCTGVSAATALPVEVVVVISDDALLAGAGGSAHVHGYGPIPAAIARDLIGVSNSHDAATTLRKLYAAPATGAVTAMESAARSFPKSLAKLIDRRDRWCRTPYCNAEIRHHDHVAAHRTGGATSEQNGEGLCAACNYQKEAPGWSASVVSGPGELHSVQVTTPTGHTYRSTAPYVGAPANMDRKAS